MRACPAMTTSVRDDRPTWRDHPLVQLTLVRFREFLREPEAVFWSLGFPILLAAGLGIAFRARPQERLKGAVPRPPAPSAAARAPAAEPPPHPAGVPAEAA